MLNVILAALLVACTNGHYHDYDWKVMQNNFPEDFVAGEDESCDHAKISSYHIHVLFWQNNKDHVESALNLRNDFINRFELINKNCTITAGDPAPGHEMCVFEVDWNPAGPFTTAQYSFFIPPYRLQDTSIWMLQNKGDHDVFIHPNSGCETDDHTKWNTFSGAKWPIDASVFTCNYPGCKPNTRS